MSVNEKMTAIADAIRAKTGGTSSLTLDGMADAIAGIQTGGGIDTSDATATAEDMAKGVTAYVKGKMVTGTLYEYTENTTEIFGHQNTEVSEKITDGIPYLYVRGQTTGTGVTRKGSWAKVRTPLSTLGDASASDVAEGKTFTSTAGLKVTGTHKCSLPNLQSKTVTPSKNQQTVSPDSGYDYLSSVTINGDANLVSSNIKSGVAIFGVSGSYTGSGGTSNIQTQHITSASESITISGTGTVKVWGYGYKSGSYSGTTYAFVGDGYYSGGYGTPSKTTATFSISNGQLSGIPSGLTSIDVLVTIGE